MTSLRPGSNPLDADRWIGQAVHLLRQVQRGRIGSHEQRMVAELLAAVDTERTEVLAALIPAPREAS